MKIYEMVAYMSNFGIPVGLPDKIQDTQLNEFQINNE